MGEARRVGVAAQDARVFPRRGPCVDFTHDALVGVGTGDHHPLRAGLQMIQAEDPHGACGAHETDHGRIAITDAVQRHMCLAEPQTVAGRPAVRLQLSHPLPSGRIRVPRYRTGIEAGR